jgi:hypothetical protein
MALAVGLVGGTVFGLREAALTLYANATIQPGQYFLLYLATLTPAVEAARRRLSRQSRRGPR